MAAKVNSELSPPTTGESPELPPLDNPLGLVPPMVATNLGSPKLSPPSLWTWARPKKLWRHSPRKLLNSRSLPSVNRRDLPIPPRLWMSLLVLWDTTNFWNLPQSNLKRPTKSCTHQRRKRKNKQSVYLSPHSSPFRPNSTYIWWGFLTESLCYSINKTIFIDSLTALFIFAKDEHWRSLEQWWSFAYPKSHDR